MTPFWYISAIGVLILLVGYVCIAVAAVEDSIKRLAKQLRERNESEGKQ